MIERRLTQLEKLINTCTTCRDWDTPRQIELMTEAEDRANPLPHIPDTCPDCRRVIRHSVRRIVVPTLEEVTA
jgi:hypothetical protein